MWLFVLPALAADLGALTAALTPEVAALHELPLLEPIVEASMRPDELLVWLDERLLEEAEQVKRDQELYRMLGLMPDDADLLALTRQLFSEQVAGLYDPQEKQLFIVDLPGGSVPALTEIFLAHEIAHALDDQHFDLGARMEAPLTSDERLALQSVIEGSATVLMLRYMAKAAMSGELETKDLLAYAKEDAQKMAQLDRYPAVLPTTLMVPYLGGLQFFLWGRRPAELMGPAPWLAPGRAAAYQDVPVSTEQILHPEKYWQRRDLPVRFAPLPEAWPVQHHDVVGELLTALVLEPDRKLPSGGALSGIPDGDSFSSRPAIGWDGDALYLMPEGQALWVSAWDDEKERREFVRAVRRAHPGWQVRLEGSRMVLLGIGMSDAELGRMPVPAGVEGDAAWTP